jgi:hypothetical protein
MPQQIPFRFGRLDYSGAPAFNARTVTIQDPEVQLALGGAGGMILPPSYPAQPAAVQNVALSSIVLDFGQRLVDYDKDRLRSIISALKSGTPLPPLSVNANADGTYSLLNGYHRFLACALLGFTLIPIDKAQAAPAAVAAPVPAWRPKSRLIAEKKF